MVVERGVPVPQKVSGPRPKWPWNEMVVGDSFVVKTADERHNACTAARTWAKYHGLKDFKTASRMVMGGFRVWRLA